jgi:hypothetical protein
MLLIVAQLPRYAYAYSHLNMNAVSVTLGVICSVRSVRDSSSCPSSCYGPFTVCSSPAAAAYADTNQPQHLLFVSQSHQGLEVHAVSALLALRHVFLTVELSFESIAASVLYACMLDVGYTSPARPTPLSPFVAILTGLRWTRLPPPSPSCPALLMSPPPHH